MNTERPVHIRETKSQIWKQAIMPLGEVMPEYPYAKLFRFRDNIYSFFSKSFDGHGDPWVHLILGQDRALLIDTGFGIGDLKAAVEKLVGDRELLVTNTHPHIDHAYGNGQFEKVYVHKYAIPYLERYDEHMWDHLYDEEGKGIWREFDVKDIIPFKKPEYAACENHHMFDLGGGYEVEMIFLPGHNCAHCVFLDKKDRILFGGDTLLYVCGIPDDQDKGMPYDEYNTVEALRDELKMLVNRMDEFDCVFMSHMVLGEDKQLVKDMYDACCDITRDPDCNQYIEKRRGGLTAGVRVCGMAAVSYPANRVYKKIFGMVPDAKTAKMAGQ